MLLIHLLGSPEIVRDGHLVPVARRKTRALLFYLATRRGPTSRDHVIDLLWADLPRPAAQQTLRATLYGLRKAIGPVLAGDDMLQLDPGTDVDVWELDDALGGARDRAQLAAALGRYRGDFLDGFSLPDVPAFDDWVGGTRERYRQAVVRGLSALARSYEAAADAGPAAGGCAARRDAASVPRRRSRGRHPALRAAAAAAR
jgi:DNA-binding SARP family transcriptional activator